VRRKDRSLLISGFKQQHTLCTRVGKITVTDIDWFENDALAHAELFHGEVSLGRKTLFFQFSHAAFTYLWGFNL
jgi:hypothetical protein